MKITYRLKKGNQTEILSKIDKSIQWYSKDHDVKVGITTNPERRSSNYKNDTDYTRMVVLFKTQSSRVIRSFERDLVDYHWELIDNETGGGGGPLGSPPYYLYLVFKEERSWVEDLTNAAVTMGIGIIGTILTVSIIKK